MPISQIIVTSRYLKSDGRKSKTKRSNFTKYIATRESVEKRTQTAPAPNAHSTVKQRQLINDLLAEFPMTKQYHEYSDYTSNPTAENASELITTIIERHADVLGNRRNFVGYMAMRPGAERRGEHGLFNDSDAPIDLNAVANEVADHPGTVWTHVVSLRREDAVRLGYTNSDMWRELVKRHISDIAKAQNILLENMKWYAAFHDTTHYPHIHLIVYSAEQKQGYLTKDGINKIRSIFANDIFHDDLQSIYQEQTLTRDELKALSENNMSEIVSQLGSEEFDERLVVKIKELYSQLKTAKGKKVYGYLPKEIKQTVDDIFALLAENANIKNLYDKWCEFERAKNRFYTRKPKDFPPLTENSEFRSVKNMIIRIVMKMDSIPTVIDIPDIVEISNDDNTLSDDIDMSEKDAVNSKSAQKVNVKRKKAQKYIDGADGEQDIEKGVEILSELADNGDNASAYRLGKMYLNGEFIYKDNDKAETYLRQASADNEYAMYALAKLYLTDEYNYLDEAVRLLDKACSNESVKPYAVYAYAKILLYDDEFHNTEKAVQLLKETADSNNWCSYLLGRLYLFGNDDVKKDKDEAIKWLTISAEYGNETATALLNSTDNYEHTILANTVFSLITDLGRIIEEDNMRSRKKISSQVDRKLRSMIQRKKQELGIKSDGADMHYDY